MYRNGFASGIPEAYMLFRGLDVGIPCKAKREIFSVNCKMIKRLYSRSDLILYLCTYYSKLENVAVKL